MGKLLTKERKRALALKVIPFIAAIFIKLLYHSCRKVYHMPKELPKGPIIIGFWHEYILFSSFIFNHSMPKGEKCSVIISEHFDGNLIAETVKYFGIGSIRGSSTRGSIKAIKESFKLLNQGVNVAITPDGPKGPRHYVADGIVSISKKKGVPIVTYKYKASSFWRLNSWDKFLIPKPFSKVEFYISEPFYVNDMKVDDAKKLIKEKLSEMV